MDWQGKRVLVCGGMGFVGSHLARELLKRGAEVYVVDNESSGSFMNIIDIAEDIRYGKMDLRNPDYCKVACRGKDVVFQLAANMGGIGYITAVGAEIMWDSAQINLNMIDAANNQGVEHYFYSSSACVYPEYKQTEAEVIPLKEADAIPAQPDQFYGWEKLFTEKLSEAHQRDYGMNIRVARFHNIFGPAYTAFDKVKGKAPAHMIIKAMKHPDPPFVIWGDGKQTRSFCYIDDCVEAVLRLMETMHMEPINIGTDYLVNMDELAAMAIKLTGKDIKPIYDLNRPQGVRGRNADLTIMEKVLGWRPATELYAGMEITYQFAVEHYDELEGV